MLYVLYCLTVLPSLNKDLILSYLIVSFICVFLSVYNLVCKCPAMILKQ